MKLKSSFYLAFKNIFNRSGEKDLFKHIKGAVIGIALSIVPLVIVLQVTDGMIQGITGRYIELGSYHLQVNRFSKNAPDINKDLLESIRKIPGVKDAFEFIQGTSLVYTKKGRAGVPVRGIPSDLYAKDEKMREYIKIVKGGFNLENEQSIILSRVIAERLETDIGDELKLLTAYSRPGRPLLLKPSKFIIEGIITTGYNDLDEKTVFINRSRAEDIFREENSRSIGIKVDNPYVNIADAKEAVKSVIPQGYYVDTWDRINYPFYKSLETTKQLLIFIMLLILCVASVNISSSMIMMVLAKQKEIAVLKSIGSSPSEIMLVYLLTGFLIGLAGTLAGIVAGILCAININGIIYSIEALLNIFNYLIWYIQNIFTPSEFNPYRILESGYYLEKIPVVLNYMEIFLVSFASVSLSVVASLLPAARAGRIKPVEILQKH